MPMMLTGIAVMCIFIAVNIALWIGGIYVVLHFVGKWW